MTPKSLKSAFTLLELSIVLVIISLLIGGTLVGRDLIIAADIRKTISQKEEFDTAANTFKVKYNCLPGDCANSHNFGLGSGVTHHFYTSGRGNGDGVVCNPQTPHTNISGYNMSGSTECINFWHHLYTSELLKYNLAGLSDLSICFVPGFHSPIPPIAKPYNVGIIGCGSTTSPLRGGWGVLDTQAISSIPVGRPGLVYNPVPFIGRSYIILANASYNGSTPNVISANDMSAIDLKIDDGLPLTGKVFAISLNMYSAPTPANLTTFAMPYTTNVYPPSNTSSATMNFVMKAGF